MYHLKKKKNLLSEKVSCKPTLKKITPNGTCEALRTRWPEHKREGKNKTVMVFVLSMWQREWAPRRAEGGCTFHSLSGLISRPLGRLRLLLAVLLLLLLLLTLHLLHVPLLGGRLKLT